MPIDTFQAAVGWLQTAERITVLSGAGISTDSGIADFRGPQGVWTRNPEAEKMATLDHYLHDPEVRRRSWRTRTDSPIWDAQPNPGHLAIAAIDAKTTVVTQNIDGLHQKAGSTRVIEVHGNARRTRCTRCRDERPMAETLDRVRRGEEDPPCLALAAGSGGAVCGGILKSATISFGENLDPDVIAAAITAAGAAEVFLVVGSTLTVHPAAGLVPQARRTADRIIIANAQPTPYDPLADAVFREPLSELLPPLLECRPAR